tara:strand:+ start:162 stop:608 length:447 start_codon:yes stop_codon:yes gene_type:complete
MNEETNEMNEERLLRLRRLSERLDETFTIPGTNYKIGIDPLIGAIPIIGDLIGAILSTYIIYSGIKMGASPKVVRKMVTNIVIEVIIGSPPLIGDVFDFFWKANKKNVELIEEIKHLDEETNKLNYLIIAALAIALTGLVLAIIAIIY